MNFYSLIWLLPVAALTLTPLALLFGVDVWRVLTVFIAEALLALVYARWSKTQ